MTPTNIDLDGPSIRVIVAEDEEPLRAALGDLIAGQRGLELVGTASDADAAIELARTLTPDVALLDIRMPGGGGLRAAAEICVVSPGTRSIALSAYEERSNVLELLRAGAVSYLVKGSPPTEILDAIRRAVRGQSSLSTKLVADLVGDVSRNVVERAEADEVVRRNEARFTRMLEATPDAVVIVDGSGRIFFANKQTEALFGYDRSELLDQSIEILIPSRFHAHHLLLRDGYLANPLPRPIGAGLELAGRRKTGVEFPVDISLSAIETSDGRLVAAFVRDATERKARADLERAIASRHAVLAHLVSASEKERGRIAADIHDDSIQVVTAAGIRLQILRESLDDPTQLRLLDELGETIQHAISRLRHLLFELRPPTLDHEGLGPALRMYLHVADEQTDTVYRLDDRLISQPAEATRLILYRIAQEVLTNVRKHAQATTATVTLSERDEGYYVRIVDDGVGFVPEAAADRPGHLGIAAIRERAELAGGWLRVESKPGEGTTVEFWIAPDAETESSQSELPAPAGVAG